MDDTLTDRGALMLVDAASLNSEIVHRDNHVSVAMDKLQDLERSVAGIRCALEEREGTPVKKTVSVSGIWVRKIGGEADPNPRVEVLVELPDGEWRRIYTGPVAAFTDGEVSHIVEPAGIVRAPRVEI